MKVGVTGATGHIGENIVRELIAGGHQVSVLFRSGKGQLEGLGVGFEKGDVTDEAAVNRFCEGQEVVIHLAGKIGIGRAEQKGIWEVNVLGTKNIIAACKRQAVRRLVHFSSVHAYRQEPRNQPLDESRPFAGENAIAYDRAKAEAHRQVAAANGDKLETLILCPSAVIGPHDYRPSRMGEALLLLFRRKMPALVRGGFNWVDVRDISKATMASLTAGTPGESYFLAGHFLEIREIASMMREVTGIRGPRLVLPGWLATAGLPFVGLASLISGKPPIYNAESLRILNEGNPLISHAKAQAELGYQARPFKETLADTFTWFQENGYLSK